MKNGAHSRVLFHLMGRELLPHPVEALQEAHLQTDQQQHLQEFRSRSGQRVMY